MARITFTTQDNHTTQIDVEAGTTLMQAAVNNGIEAIIGECGGLCNCATCQGYNDHALVSTTGDAGDTEKDMLECAIDPEPNSLYPGWDSSPALERSSPRNACLAVDWPFTTL